MTKHQHINNTMQGWCNFENLYSEIADWIPDGGTWVEVGVYAGKSFSFGIVECLNRGKKIDFVAVDKFPDEWIYDIRPDGQTVWDKFEKGMAPLAGHFRVIKGLSVEVAEQFADGSVDFVFIDAEHTYDAVKADIEAWTRKVKPGGIIAGHDYDDYWQGLIQAVNEAFGDRVQRVVSDNDKHLFCWKVQL